MGQRGPSSFSRWLKQLFRLPPDHDGDRGSAEPKPRGTGPSPDLLPSLIATILRLLGIAQQHAVNSPALSPVQFRSELKQIAERYRGPLSAPEEEELRQRSVELIANQRAREMEYFGLKEEELKAIIALITDEIKGSVDENEILTGEMSRSVEALREAADIQDLQEIRQRISRAVEQLSEQIERRRNQDAAQMHILEEQMEILCSQLDTAELESKTDGLTTLYNRRAFDDQIRLEVSLAQRLDRPLCLVMCDIDHFKKVNDTHGHQVGDDVLVNLADHMVKEFFRTTDFVARYGGEEFAVIMSQTPQRGALTAAHGLREGAARIVIPAESGPISITISAGVAEYIPGESAKDLIDRADQALYEAKEGGRNRVVAAEERGSAG